LENSYADSVHNFNLGQIAFHQKKYEEADNHFFKVELSDANYMYFINCKILRLKCLYELGHLDDKKERVNHEYIEGVFKVAKEYIRNNTLISPADKEGYKNFIQTLNTIYRIRHGLGKITIEQLKRI